MEAGLSPAEFWNTTPREAGIILEAAGRRDWHWVRLAQGLVYSLAQLVGHAFHAPKKMPRFEKAFPDRRRKRVQTDAEMFAAAQKWVAEAEAIQKAGKEKG